MSDVTPTPGPAYADGERYRRGRDVLASMGNDPDGLAHWRTHVEGPVGEEIDRLLGEYCFGDVWAGDGLDKRTRRIIVLTTLATQYRPVQLKGHVKGALEQGLTRREITEVFRQLVPYTGFPSVLSALDVVQEAFDEVDADREA